MTIDMPPKIPPAIVEYVNEYNLLPDNVKKLNADNASDYIFECQEKYNGYNIYRLGYIDRISYNYVGYKYKNCYLLLSKENEVRCATDSEEKYLIYKYPNLTNRFTADIPIDVIKVARTHTKSTEAIDIKGYDNSQYISQVFYYFEQKPKTFNGYYIYYLGFPYYKTYGKNCDIILHNDNETRCATKEEHFRILVPMGK